MLLRPHCSRLSGCVGRQACAGRSQRLGSRKLTVKASAAPEDPWQTLGVSRDADAKTVKKAYRQLALRSHPDLNKDPGAASTFLRIQGAYETLSGRRRGKSTEQPSSKRGDWDFHDWYWQFSASRKWEKTHQRKERAASAHAAAASPAQTRSQLNGLRRKAAFRKHKAQRAPSEPQPANMRRSWDVHVHAERDEPQSTTQRSAAHQEPLRQQQPQASAPLQHGGPSTSGRHSHHASPLFDGQTPAAAAATSRGNPHDQQISTAVFPVDFQQWGSLHACLAMLSLHLLHTSAVHHNSSTALQAEDGSSSSLVPAVHRGSSSSNHGDSNSAREARKHDSDAALAGMQGLQSQLAGLRRRSAMRPV